MIIQGIGFTKDSAEERRARLILRLYEILRYQPGNRRRPPMRRWTVIATLIIAAPAGRPLMLAEDG